MKPIELFIIFMYLWSNIKATCVMRSECIEIGGHAKLCPFNDEAPPLLEDVPEDESNEIIAILEHRCPYLLYDENGERKPDNEVNTCCDITQVRKMEESLALADTIIGRCPMCLRNFMRQVCELNCSPDQSRFVDVYTEFTNDIEYVNEVDYRMNENFMLNAHASCLDVVVPQTGLPAINLMCGNAPVCDAQSWFGFTGDTANNPFAPVQVNFLSTADPNISMNAPVLACNDTYRNDLPCSCVDCALNCPLGTEPFVPEDCTIGSMHCLGFALGITFFIIGVSIFTILTVLQYRKLRKVSKAHEEKDDNNDSPSNTKSDINKVTKWFQMLLAKIGGLCASNPVFILLLTSWLVFSMTIGVLRINITSNPLELWSAPNSRSRHELNYFNSRFGPFYRAAQVYLRFDGLEPFQVGNITYGPAYRIEALEELVKLEDAIMNIGRDDGGVTLEQVCYAPLRVRGTAGSLDQCVLMSASVYLGYNRDSINNNTYLNQIQNCINNFYSFDCTASWGGGSEPEISFGGYEDNILEADTLLINFPISNHLLTQDLEPVLEWEKNFLALLSEYDSNGRPDFVDVSYGADRSIEDEIERVSKAEIVPIAISYLLMFIYVTVFLGNVRYCKTWFIDSKITVAFGCIITELIAIYCAMGVMGYAGFTTTLLAINVIPFFVLSVGIDNVFLMVNTLHDIESNLKQYDDYNENFSFTAKKRWLFSKMLGKVGPSMFVSSSTQITCFGIGTLANFPAVVTFAVFACLSLSFMFVLQITTVIAILSIDYNRVSQNRFDVFCCIRKKVLVDSDPINSDVPYKSVIKRLMKPYSTFLLHGSVKFAVVIIFMAMLLASCILIPHIDVGLDQEMSLPTDSYVYKYLQAVNHLLKLGPPVYFVLKPGLNFTDPDHQDVVCGGQLCNDDSLTTQIYLAAQYSNITYMYRSSNSWIDDFFDWTSAPGSCCKYNITDGSFCPSMDTSNECAFCSIDRQEFVNGIRPTPEVFGKYLPFFLQDTPTDSCNKGGLASYFNSVNYILDDEGSAVIYDTSFMAYHVPLATSYDYITAVKYAYEISKNITDAIKRNTGLDVEVFPYSVFYVYYEQYLTMWTDTFNSIAYCLLGAFVFNLLASGFNIISTFSVIFTALLVVINMMGVMYIWSIPLNAVSCVNLIVSIGIAVEFCSHIAYAFTTSEKPSNERVHDALISVGNTVITGITFTNIPIIILAFSYTEIIEVFFFRMFFGLVILGLLHGMVFFPVLLSFLNDLKGK